MHLVDVVLFAHIAVAIVAFAVAGILHTAQWVSRTAGTTAELRTWGRVAHRIEPLFPVLALVLFLLGVWLLHLSHGEFRWGQGWVITAAVTLGLMELLGGAILAPRSTTLFHVLDAAADGPPDASARAAACDPTVWIVSHFITGLATGVLYLMATKPSGGASLAVVVVVGAMGAAIGAAGVRTAVTVPSVAAEATAG
jgi:hypothetical protein